MGEAPDLEKVIQDALLDVALPAALRAAVAAVPFLGMPIINPVFIFLATTLAKLIYKELALQLSFTIIDIETQKELKEYTDAKDKFKDVLSSPVQNYPSEGERNAALQKARDEFKAKTRDLIRLRPAA
jgi:hypothetical protein